MHCRCFNGNVEKLNVCGKRVLQEYVQQFATLATAFFASI